MRYGTVKDRNTINMIIDMFQQVFHNDVGFIIMRGIAFLMICSSMSNEKFSFECCSCC